MASQVDIRNAAIEGNLEKLIAEGADVNARMNTGNLNTPLHNAVSRGNDKVAEVLLDNGADITAKNKNGETALHLAVRHNFLNIIDLLLKKGADIQETDNEFNSPLHKAAIVHNAKAVELLLKRGADRDAGCDLTYLKSLENDDGKKPFQLAIRDEVKKAFEKA